MGVSTPDRARVYATVLYWQKDEVPLLERCIASLLQQTALNFDLQIIVIDNGCGASVTLPHQVQVVHLAENRGFTGGHNAALRLALEAGADYVFLVNTDLVADSACLSELLAAASSHPGVGMLGPLVLRESQPQVVESNGQAFDRWTGRHREVDRGAEIANIALTPHGADAISGCALLVSRAVLEGAGLLDERLFFHFEDMDWCLRARAAGFGVLVVPTARVWHRGGGSVGADTSRTTFFAVRNHLTVAMRYARFGWAVAPLVIGYHLAFLARASERRSGTHLRAALLGALAGLRGALGPTMQ